MDSEVCIVEAHNPFIKIYNVDIKDEHCEAAKTMNIACIT
jgi:hypothetical protein